MCICLHFDGLLFYCDFVRYPHSVAMLDLLVNNPPFRKASTAVSLEPLTHFHSLERLRESSSSLTLASNTIVVT